MCSGYLLYEHDYKEIQNQRDIAMVVILWTKDKRQGH